MGFGKPLCIFMKELGESSGTASYRSFDPGESSMGGAAEIAYTQAVLSTIDGHSTV